MPLKIKVNLMKRFLSIITCFLFYLQVLMAQIEWAPIGAKWYYTTPYVSSDSVNHCTIIESKKDTLINGKTCRIVEISNCSETQVISREVLYQTNDSLFYLNNHHFFLLPKLSDSRSR